VALPAGQSTSANCQNPDNGNPVHSQRQNVSASAEFCSSRPTTAEIPYISLDTVDCATTDVTVVVSELTSSDATRFILERKGYQLLLPIDRSIGLLNAAVSGSITLFELVRQMRRKTSI
jgi:tRNA(Leu) C34 or U34 (ribose-2'-O)-methylase TrmL